MNKKITYISLFSSAGVGCYGFKMNGFDCVVTNELIERRLNVQKHNNKCKYKTGYILGDVTDEIIMSQLFDEIKNYKKKENITDIDVIMATPPCQGMSVANHKKTKTEIHRNSLVVEAINMIKKINPKFFIFENVQSFMRTNCFDDGAKKKISEAIEDNLAEKYEYVSDVINLKDYGANSSRTRTLVIGVRKDLSNKISPLDLFPTRETEKTLRELIYHMPRLDSMGVTTEDDIYHGFKKYAPHMRDWIADLKEGESAFDNKEITKKPHRVIDGEIVINQNKNGDKYTRQIWDKVAPCVHTRNDIMSSQNTVHPEDDRVFSIRELMILMNIPKEFKWVSEEQDDLNKWSLAEKQSFLKKHEINIRQSIGEAVPPVIIKEIAFNIKKALEGGNPDDRILKKEIREYNLKEPSNLHAFIKKNEENLSLNALSRVAELANAAQNETAAYYTDRNTLLSIFKNLPPISQDEIRILEPSVGTGNFIPFIIKKYEKCKSIIIDVCDINKDSLQTLKLLVKKMRVPQNVIINYINDDFMLYDFGNIKYDLVIGNPPFLKMNKSPLLKKYRDITADTVANNTSAFFVERAYQISNNVVMILPKYFLHNQDFNICREITSQYAVDTIIDFGEKGFKGILIETICLFVSTARRRGNTTCISMTHRLTNVIRQSDLVDKRFPNWLMYRNDFFDSICERIKFDIFTCYRDRQITNKILKKDGPLWVIKSRNLKRDGSGIEHILEYDTYVDKDTVENLTIAKYIDRDDVFLSPNMTYYPRVVKKPKGTLVNGSVAIFELKEGEKITDEELLYFASQEFQDFYAIARNLSTRSLNLDKNSVFYFGKGV